MRRTWVKCICAVLCVLTLTVGVLGGTFALSYYIERPQDSGFYNSIDCYRVTLEYRDRCRNLIDLRQMEERDDPSYYVQPSIEEITRDLAAENTNFRYRCLDEAGEVLDTNVPEGQTLGEVVHSISGGSWATEAYTSYGQQYTKVYILEYGVLEPLAVEDGYSAALEYYQQTTAALETIVPTLAWVCGGCLVAGLILLAILICAAGRRPGRTEVVLNLQDRVLYDLYLVLVVCGVASAAVLGDSCAY